MAKFIPDLYDDCQIWQAPNAVYSAEEAEAYDGFELGMWYIIDADCIPIIGPYDTRAEADDVLKQLRQIGRQYRGFGPQRAGDVDIQALLDQIRFTDSGDIVNGHHHWAALEDEEQEALYRAWLAREPRRWR